MQNVIINWRDYLYGMWLGSSTALAFDSGIFDIRWWFVVIPTTVLVTLFNEKRLPD